ncbi:ATP-binding cassette domain-containing protein [Ferruginibacter paludis]|uniref:ABC transporter ATP-binding protein n=1 Tax=Ferruginibacter paludis TaxID=1310417 RepID=UPI0025B57002|nr:ATP-binding cassette domain-containing protein [Ferruginibacter paludis]MDN3659228.1 ATP-binding cassette domain-containing protein [Ferruginibacter paludis]
MAIVVQTEQLSKRFGDFIAVDSLNITINEGEIYSLLGPNGAGKSTAIKMLTTLLKPSSGDAWIDGISIAKSPFKVRSLIGYVPQMLSAEGTLTGYENLLLFAKLYDIPSKEGKQRINQALAFMSLQEAAHKPVKTYSGGMIRRLEIAQSMLHRPKVLFLDEPTTGLDPIGVKSVWEHILELKKEFGTTILLTTHIMEEADKLSTHIAFLSRGKLVASGTPAELKNSLNKAGATMEDVFIYYTKESVDSQRDFHEVAAERKTTSRLG